MSYLCQVSWATLKYFEADVLNTPDLERTARAYHKQVWIKLNPLILIRQATSQKNYEPPANSRFTTRVVKVEGYWGNELCVVDKTTGRLTVVVRMLFVKPKWIRGRDVHVHQYPQDGVWAEFPKTIPQCDIVGFRSKGRNGKARINVLWIEWIKESMRFVAMHMYQKRKKSVLSTTT
jgi:hypothetical protein